MMQRGWIRGLAVPALVLGVAAGPGPEADLPPADAAWLRVNTPRFIAFGNVDARRLVEIARDSIADASILPTYVFVFRDRASLAPYAGDGDGRVLAADDRNFVLLDASAVAAPPPAAPLELRIVAVSRAEALARLGDLLLHREPPALPAAERHLEAALQLEPDNVTARIALGRLERQRGNWDAAAVAFEAALPMGGAVARAQYAWTLLVAGDAPRARALFREALDLAPDDPVALHGFGRTYRYGHDDPAEGIAALTRARELLPRRGAITVDWIALAAAAGRVDAAWAALESDLRRQEPTPEMLRDAESSIAAVEIERAVAAASQDRVEDGRVILLRALARARDPQVGTLLANTLAEFHAAVVQRTSADTFDDATAAARRGDFESAARLFERVAAGADDPGLRDSATDLARKTREQAVVQRVTTRVARAVDRANRGEIAFAIDDLESVLRDEKEMTDRMRAEVRQLRDRLRATQRSR
jgi:tetratricopeptide (TPR) repeat protein